MITIRQTGDFRNTERLLSNAKKFQVAKILMQYGQRGVDSLSLATPKDTGKTASSWDYGLEVTNYGYKVYWYNIHEEGGISPAILIQYGHGTKNGGFVQGLDYINPAMKSIFDEIAEAIWKEVIKL